MTTKLTTLLMFGAALLLAGCGSDSDETTGDKAPAAKTAGSKAADENLWATINPPPDKDAPPFDHSFTAPPPVARPDPDEVLARYEQDCAADDADSADCRALRRDVERVFLDALIGLRDAGQAIDPDVLRAAAAAETPQLACIGVRDRLRAGNRSDADWELTAVALDSPWRAPRQAAFTYARMISPPDPQNPPRAMKMLERAGDGYSGPSDICLDGWRDPLPNPGLAGHYPNARYRPFASTANRRWFTTPDSLEKVLAYFAKAGFGPARTADELKAAATANYMKAMTDMTQASDAEDAQKLQERMMKLLMQQSFDWSREFSNMEGTGEIRYVMLTPTQAIAVFKDEFLDATSIVAPAPPVDSSAMLDMEAAKHEAYVRSVFGL